MSHGYYVLGYRSVEEACEADERDEWATAPEVDRDLAMRLLGELAAQGPTDWVELYWGCLASEIRLDESEGRVIGFSAMVYDQCEGHDQELRLVNMLAEAADRMGFTLVNIELGETFDPVHPGRFLGLADDL